MLAGVKLAIPVPLPIDLIIHNIFTLIPLVIIDVTAKSPAARFSPPFRG
jgi:hypothetical protein